LGKLSEGRKTPLRGGGVRGAMLGRSANARRKVGVATSSASREEIQTKGVSGAFMGLLRPDEGLKL